MPTIPSLGLSFSKLWRKNNEGICIRVWRHVPNLLAILIINLFLIYPYLLQNKNIAVGEAPFYINPDYLNYYSIWENKFNFGNFSQHSQNISLFSVIWSIIELTPFNIEHALVFIYLNYCLASFFAYFCLCSFFPSSYTYLALAPSIFYSLNVFRLIGPINERVNLLFVFLPLLFWAYHKIINEKKWRYLIYLVFLTNISASTAGNLPVFLTPYLLMLLYFIYYLVVHKPNKDVLILLVKQNLIFGIVIFLSNLYWIYPLYHYLISLYIATNGATTIFKALNVGTFQDHLRGIGQWAWRAEHLFAKYYPFSEKYDQPFLQITTYLLTIISFIYILPSRFLKRVDKDNHLKTFFAILSFLSLILLAGNKGPFGFVFDFLYQHIPLFKAYREPFAKFTPLYIFALTFGLAYSLQYITDKLKRNSHRLLVVSLVTLLVLINAYPFFTGEAIPIRRWNGGNVGNVVSIPEYWQDARRDIPSKVGNYRLMLLPYNPYITYYSWEYGANVVGNIADYLLDVKSLKSYEIDTSLGGQILLSAFPPGELKDDFDLGKFLGFLNAKYLLLENDLEWRYSSGDVASPSASLAYLSSSNLTLEKTYGEFISEYLSTLPNEDPDPGRKQLLTSELQGKPILSLYQVPEEHLLPLVYTPSSAFISSDDPSDLPYLVTNQPNNNFAVIYQNQNDELDLDLDDLDNPEVVFSDNHPTHISLTIKDAHKPFLLVFIENFDSNWSIIPGSDFSQIAGLPLNFKKPYDTDHLIANGFANAWLINPDQFCSLSPDDCELSNQGKNLSLSLYYSPQNYLTLSLILALIINLLVVSSLVYLLIFKKKNG